MVNNLADDEEIIVSNVQTVRKNKRAVETEPIEEPFIEAEIENDADSFLPGTVGFRAFQDDDSPQHLTECNILVVRKPDGAGDKFLKPCNGRYSETPIRNVDLNQPETEIEEIVRQNCGGGHYYLQTQFGNRNGRGWTVSLADSPEAIAKAKAEHLELTRPANPPPQPLPVAVNPFQQRIDDLKLEREYDELKFGEERRRLSKLEAELEELRRSAAVPQTPPANQSESLTILEHALKSNNPTIQDKLLEYAFPSRDENSSHWVVDLFKTVMENKEELAGIASMLLGGIVPAPPQNNIESILRSQPPSSLPQPVPEPNRPQFQRERPPVEPPVFVQMDAADEPSVTIDNDIDSDDAGEEIREQSESNLA